VVARCQELRDWNLFLEKAPQLALERLAKKEIKATRYRKLISMYTYVEEDKVDRDLEDLITDREYYR